MEKVTINDVAEKAQVSIKTVSRVLNREPSVRSTTREHVEQVISLMNYHPDPSARRLAGKRSFLIGILYDNPSPSYVIDNQAGVLSQCRKYHYDLLIHPCDYLDDGLADDVKSFIKQTRPDGVILTPPLSDMPGLIKILENMETSFVCIGRAKSGRDISRVITNDKDMAYQMTRHLIDLGHRKIAFIKGHPDHKAVSFREQGFTRAMRDGGLKIRNKYIAQGYNSFQSGQECAEKLLGRKDLPTAIFAANDDMATGVIKAAYNKKILVPDELSVVGFDDVPFASQVSPGLTTVRQPIYEMAEMAAEMLIKRIADRANKPKDILVGGKLVIRGSTAKPVSQ